MMNRTISLMLIMVMAGPSVCAEGKWRDLFNGKNLKGWELKNGKAEFVVEGKTIVGKSVANEPNSFLCTKSEYSDFILEFEFFASPEMNSGVMIRGLSTKEYQNYRVHGYQVELEDEDQERDWSGLCPCEKDRNSTVRRHSVFRDLSSLFDPAASANNRFAFQSPHAKNPPSDHALPDVRLKPRTPETPASCVPSRPSAAHQTSPTLSVQKKPPHKPSARKKPKRSVDTFHSALQLFKPNPSIWRAERNIKQRGGTKQRG